MAATAEGAGNMSWEVFCDGCRKQEPALYFKTDKGFLHAKPKSWMQTADHRYDACSPECASKIDENIRGLKKSEEKAP